MKPLLKREDAAPSSAQLEITKSMIAATAEITAAMVTVTNEKNPAKISEAFRVIYKTIQDVVRGSTPKPTAVSTASGGGGEKTT